MFERIAQSKRATMFRAVSKQAIDHLYRGNTRQEDKIESKWLRYRDLYEASPSMQVKQLYGINERERKRRVWERYSEHPRETDQHRVGLYDTSRNGTARNKF
jgi:hypothetical protein